MRTIKISDTKRKIILPGIREVVAAHPQFSVVFDQLSLQKATVVFTNIIEAFKSGELSSDELSTFGNHLFGFATKHPKSDLFQATLAAAEVSFYIRYHPDRIVSFLKIIDEFHEKNKKSA